jgi:hypothetical protein
MSFTQHLQLSEEKYWVISSYKQKMKRSFIYKNDYFYFQFVRQSSDLLINNHYYLN